MIDLMHSETDEYGVLVIDGVIPDERRIAKLISLEATEVRSALKELGDNQVYSRRDDGAIFSRRMVRDHARIEQAREHGKLGGNPTLKPRGKTWAA
jgi:tRNA(His) 5'-end guanylyltransferase